MGRGRFASFAQTWSQEEQPASPRADAGKASYVSAVRNKTGAHIGNTAFFNRKRI